MSAVAGAVLRNRYPLYAAARRLRPVLQLPRPAITLLFDFESVKRALTDHDTFSSRAAPPGDEPLDWMIFSDQPRHTKLRAIVMRAFTPNAIAALEPRIRDLSASLLEPFLRRGEIELVADYAVPLPLTVIADLLGVPTEALPRLKRWSDAILGLGETVAGGAVAARAAAAYGAARAEMDPYVGALLAERRETPRDDLLTRLVQAEVDGDQLLDTEILSFFELLLLAGNETTTNLIANTMLTLLEHPRERERLAADPELLVPVLEEVLRYRSPVQAVFRQTTREVTLRGKTIPAGRLVLAMVGSANRDPRQFPDPGRFDPARTPNAHVAFGHGIHFCLGAPLARLEARIAVADLLRALRNPVLGGDGWQPGRSFHVHGPSRLPIRFEPREPLRE